jgi:hypothetical protein
MDYLQLFWRILDTTCTRNFTGSDLRFDFLRLVFDPRHLLAPIDNLPIPAYSPKRSVKTSKSP